ADQRHCQLQSHAGPRRLRGEVNDNYTAQPLEIVDRCRGGCLSFEYIFSNVLKRRSTGVLQSKSAGGAILPHASLRWRLGAMPRPRRRADRFSRRVFIHRLAFLGGGAVLIGPACKRDSAPAASASSPDASAPASPYRTFTEPEFAILSAACERIIPRDEDPGAIDANVPQYIDRMLQTKEMRKAKVEFVPGVLALNRRSRRR